MISVIIPAYNAERYLEASIESVISQSISDWELLLIDDGSTDSTPRICDSYAASDPRIRVIHRPLSQGPSAARNDGIDAARGEHIAFLDADDILGPDFLKNTRAALMASDADFVAVPFIPFDSETLSFSTPSPQTPCIELRPLQAIENTLCQRHVPGTHAFLDNSAWGKLYRADLWKSTRFIVGLWYEDLDIFYRLWQKASKIAFIPNPMVGYRQHPKSYLHTFSPTRAHVLDVTDRMVRYYADPDKSGLSAREIAPLLKAARTRRFAAHWNILLLLRRYKADLPEVRERCRRLIRAERSFVLRNPRARLKDRLGALLAFLAPA